QTDGAEEQREVEPFPLLAVRRQQNHGRDGEDMPENAENHEKHGKNLGGNKWSVVSPQSPVAKNTKEYTTIRVPGRVHRPTGTRTVRGLFDRHALHARQGGRDAR